MTTLTPPTLNQTLSPALLAQELARIASAFNRITGKHALKHYYSLPQVTQATPEALAILEEIKIKELASNNLTPTSDWPLRTDGLVARLQIAILHLDPTTPIIW